MTFVIVVLFKERLRCLGQGIIDMHHTHTHTHTVARLDCKPLTCQHPHPDTRTLPLIIIHKSFDSCSQIRRREFSLPLIMKSMLISLQTTWGDTHTDDNERFQPCTMIVTRSL